MAGYGFQPTSFKYPLTQDFQIINIMRSFQPTSFKYPLTQDFQIINIMRSFQPTSFKYPLTLLIKSRILLNKDSAFILILTN